MDRWTVYWLGAVATASLVKMRDPDPIMSVLITFVCAIGWPIFWFLILIMAVNRK